MIIVSILVSLYTTQQVNNSQEDLKCKD